MLQEKYNPVDPRGALNDLMPFQALRSSTLANRFCQRRPADGHETTIIERYRRLESSVEETLIDMYLAGVSVPLIDWTFHHVVQ